MSTTNPPKSSGSSLEQAGRKQQNLPLLVAVFLLLHAVVLGGILWVGCKPHKEDMAKNEAPPPSPLGLDPIGGTNSPFFEPLDNSQSPASPGPTLPGGPPAGPVGPPSGSISPGITSGPIPPPGEVTPTPAAPSGPLGSQPGPHAEMPRPEPPPPPPSGITPGAASQTTIGQASPTLSRPGPAPAARTHVVGRGDTYYSIAREYKTTMAAMKTANPGVDPTKLQLGQKLNVPAPVVRAGSRPRPTGSTYVVKSGDNLGRIARKHSTTVDKLRAINGLTSDRILVGQVLKLPSN